MAEMNGEVGDHAPLYNYSDVYEKTSSVNGPRRVNVDTHLTDQ